MSSPEFSSRTSTNLSEIPESDRKEDFLLFDDISHQEILENTLEVLRHMITSRDRKLAAADVDGLQKDWWIEELERDDLTELYVRKSFRKRIAEEVAKNPARPRALLKIDVGNQKALNDIVAYKEGDSALKRIGAHIREGDLIGGRHGGDEIYILADLSPHDDKDELTNEERLDAIVHRFHLLGEEIDGDYPVLKQSGLQYNIAIGGVLLTEPMTYSQLFDGAADALEVDKTLQRQKYGEYRTKT